MSSTDLVTASGLSPTNRSRWGFARPGVLFLAVAGLVVAGHLLGVERLILTAIARPAPTPVVHLAPVTRGNLVSTVSATGTLAFARTATITPKLTGTVSTFSLRVGDPVRVGATVATLDPADLDAQLSQAEITLKSARAKLGETEAPPTSTELDSAKAALVSAQQKLDQTLHPYSDADLASQKAAVDLTQTQLTAAEHPYTAADIAAQQETVRQDQVAIVEARDSLVVVEKSSDVSRAVRDAQDQENWYEVAYGKTLHAYQAGQASKQKLDADWSNLMSAKEALATAQAKSEADLLTAKNQVTTAEATLKAAQEKLAAMQAGPTAADLASVRAALTQAQDRLAFMEQSPSATDVKAAKLAVQAAQDQLDALNQGPNPSSVALAKLSVDAAQSSVDALQKQQADLAVTSPISGTVLALGSSSTNSSQTMGVGASVTPATVFAIVADPTQLQVDATVSEVDVARLKVGDGATLSVPALPNQTFHGRVSRISPQATSNQGVVTYGVTVAVTDPSAALRPGMSANVAIVVGQATNAVQVPVAAVQTAHGQSIVMVISPAGQSRMVPVTTGLLGTQTIQVTGNLQPGQKVAIDLSQAPTAQGGPPPPGGAPILGGGK